MLLWHGRLGDAKTILIFLAACLLAGCERPPVQTVQTGYRGTAAVQVYNPRTLESQAELNAMPEIDPPARVRAGVPKAGAVYKNVQVLGDLSLGEFGRTMSAITKWVAPNASCVYCHVEGNFADDSKYTKVVARRMIQMTRYLNSDWKSHLGGTGVTCYTCHRGQPLPAQRWFLPKDSNAPLRPMGDRAGQNAPARSVALTSLPNDPFSAYLMKVDGSADIRLAGSTAMAGTNQHSVKQAEHTYGLMVHISKSLGVNCTFCHNTRAFASWAESTPKRVTAWYGIRMARQINTQFLGSLTGTFPAIPEGRLGPMRDVAKVNCATCHQGAYKPIYGAQMAKHYPAFWPAPALVAAAEAASDVPSATASQAGERPAPAVAAAAAASAAPAVAPPAPPSVAGPASAAVAPAAPSRTTAPPAAAPAPVVANCIDAAAAATRSGTRVPVESAGRLVTGNGRLAFYSAPDYGCEMQGVYILPGDMVDALIARKDFTWVKFRRASTGAEASGWVLSDRLAVSIRPATGPSRATQATLPAASAASVLTARPSAPGGSAARVGDPCTDAAAATTTGSKPVPADTASRRVTGAGRLQFHSAPDAACAMKGVFILQGEAVTALAESQQYTLVNYINPRAGNEATGWVRSDRLARKP